MAVDDARHDVLAGAVDDARVRRSVEILPDGGDLAVAKSTSVFCSVPCVTVSTVALRMSVSGDVGLCARAALTGNVVTIARNRSLAMSRFIVYSDGNFSRNGADGATDKTWRRCAVARNLVWLS